MTIKSMIVNQNLWNTEILIELIHKSSQISKLVDIEYFEPPKRLADKDNLIIMKR